MSDHELLGWLTLRKIPQFGDRLIRKLMEVYPSSEAVFCASGDELMERTGIPKSLACEIQDISWQRRAQDEIKAIQREGIVVMTLKDIHYPESLSAIPDPPPILYMKGEYSSADPQAVAIVGSRKASPYGIRTAERISSELAAYGFTIISGLARGIDSAAHRGALTAGGRTLAVLGCGLDILYPPENTNLQERIVQKGAVFSELPLGTAPLPNHFPNRNRIISGLSLGTLVVEAAARSGSLITAQCALEQGREVFAIPGNLGLPNSQGANRLIKAGAKLVEEACDIVEELQPQLAGRFQVATKKKPAELDSTEETLYELLSDEPRHIDELVTESRLSSAQVTGVLLQLELKGTIKHLLLRA
jgi:DNA processing protein